MEIAFSGSFAGDDFAGMVAPLRALEFLPDYEPSEITVDDHASKAKTLAAAMAHAKESVWASFETMRERCSVSIRQGLLKCARPGAHVAPGSLAKKLADVPFTIASFESPFAGRAAGWGSAGTSGAYLAPSFSDGHFSLGWGCAFQGKGIERLVSPNWLVGGPWAIHESGDTTFVQFYDLAADAKTALAQAKPGHRQMGIGDEGGFIQSGYVFEHELKGLYDAKTQTMKVVVLGRELPASELLDWAALRVQNPDPSNPVAHVAFAFPDPAEAEANLPRLWRYGHQVIALRDGKEVRIDTDYHPTHVNPSWA